MAFRLKPFSEKLQRPSRERITDRLSRNKSVDSIASVIFPWRTAWRSRPTLVVGNQAGREVAPAGFFFCMASVMLLITAVGICAATIWAIVHRLPYMQLVDTTLLLRFNIFSLCGGLLGFPCFWIAWMSPDNTENITFLPLLMVTNGLCVIMHIIGTSIGMVYKFQMKFDMKTRPPKLHFSQYQRLLNDTMMRSMSRYDTNYKHRSAWDKVQQQLKCCGTAGFADWFNIRKKIPHSCCGSSCKNLGIYTAGCIDRVAFDLSWQTSLILGLSYIVFAVQLFTLVISTYVYLKGPGSIHSRSRSTLQSNADPSAVSEV